MTNIKSLILSLSFALLSGLLMYLGWPTIGIFPFVFVGLVPLFFSFEKIKDFKIFQRGFVLFAVVFLAHFVWIGASLRWVHETSPKTYYTAITLESASIAIACIPFFTVGKAFGDFWKWVYFVAAWLAVEYFNQHWMMGTPYFVLGGGFGMYPKLIQIYEFIGIEGGTLLILLVNIGCFFILKNLIEKKPLKKSILFTASALLPFALSLFFSLEESEGSKKDKIRLAALHTYQETYTEDSHLHPEKTVNKLFKASSKGELNSYELLVWPETIISNMGWLNNVVNENAYKSISENLKEYPSLSICVGGYGFSLSRLGAEDPYSVLDSKNNYYYQSHNVAVTLNNTGRWPIRSKEIFIPFQERIPFLKQMPFLKNFADLVGANTMVSYYEYGDNVHKTFNGNTFVPVLCFESIYPVRMAENAKEANFIAILANEYWNKDLSGSDQYLYTNVAVAIQSRTPIVRSSNSGISAIIDSRGKILLRKKGKDIGLISQTVLKKTEETFYELIAGSIYSLGVFLMIALLIGNFFKRIFSSKKS